MAYQIYRNNPQTNEREYFVKDRTISNWGANKWHENKFAEFYSASPKRIKRWNSLARLISNVSGTVSYYKDDGNPFDSVTVEVVKITIDVVQSFDLSDVGRIQSDLARKLSEESYFETKSGGGTKASVPGISKAQDQEAG